jgi:hypothetical protein
VTARNAELESELLNGQRDEVRTLELATTQGRYAGLEAPLGI